MNINAHGWRKAMRSRMGRPRRRRRHNPVPPIHSETTPTPRLHVAPRGFTALHLASPRLHRAPHRAPGSPM